MYFNTHFLNGIHVRLNGGEIWHIGVKKPTNQDCQVTLDKTILLIDIMNIIFVKWLTKSGEKVSCQVFSGVLFNLTKGRN